MRGKEGAQNMTLMLQKVTWKPSFMQRLPQPHGLCPLPRIPGGQCLRCGCVVYTTFPGEKQPFGKKEHLHIPGWPYWIKKVKP